METTSQTSPPISDSAFHMLRCVICVAHADKIVKEQERLFVRTLVSHLQQHATALPWQIGQLNEDLNVPQNIDDLLPHVTGRKDRENLVMFAGLLAMADGALHPDEEAILSKIQAYCETHPPATGAVVPAGEIMPSGRQVARSSFASEVRDIVREELYQQKLAASGVVHGSGPVAVVDAFAENAAIVPATYAREVVTKMPRLSNAMNKSLVQGERFGGKAHFHFMYFVHTLLICGLAVWAAAPAGRVAVTSAQNLLNWLYAQGSTFYELYQKLAPVLSSKWVGSGVPLAFIASAGLFFAWRILVWMTTEIVITDSRIIFVQGIIFVRQKKLELSMIGKTDVNQTILGRLLNYGSILLYTNLAGGSPEVNAVSTTIGGVIGGRTTTTQTQAPVTIPTIADPYGFVGLIDRAMRLRRAGTFR